MNTIITKVRNLIEDGSKPIIDIFTYESIVSSKIFTLSEPNIDPTSLVCYKNGILWSVVGSSENWARVGTIVTITKTAHGLNTGDTIVITISSVPAGLPLGTYMVTKLTANTFTVVGIDSGTTPGTCTWSNYTYSTTTGKMTIGGTLVVGDSLEVDYNAHTKYSDYEIRGYIKSAITYLSIEKYGTFKVGSDNILFPTATESEENLIAVIAAILIKGDVVSYKTPELTINFERSDSKEKKIHKFVKNFKKVYGCITYIDPNETVVLEDEE